jgi:hypothetical protein
LARRSSSNENLSDDFVTPSTPRDEFLRHGPSAEPAPLKNYCPDRSGTTRPSALLIRPGEPVHIDIALLVASWSRGTAAAVL